MFGSVFTSVYSQCELVLEKHNTLAFVCVLCVLPYVIVCVLDAIGFLISVYPIMSHLLINNYVDGLEAD